MIDKIFQGVVRLRRDNDYNYAKLTTWIPASGEVCLADTSHGLKAKIGDGTTLYSALPYLDNNNNIVVRGYYYQGEFYWDSSYSDKMEASSSKMYIDIASNWLYWYTGTKYETFTNFIPVASSQQAGILKLYAETGENEDGTMTQKAITDALSSKFSVSTGEDEDLVFTTD